MDRSFWLNKWKENDIGFHQAQVNPHLLKDWKRFTGGNPGAVFVPLCGKSYDMQWLSLEGHSVVGVELSQKAIEQFFSENQLSSEREKISHFHRYQSNNIEILEGDFFDMRRDHIKDCLYIYDRASMIALPPQMRQQYVEHLKNIISPKAQLFLITIDYKRDDLGPPFSVTEEEVHQFYGDHFIIEKWYDEASEVLEKFRDFGVKELRQSLFSLKGK